MAETSGKTALPGPIDLVKEAFALGRSRYWAFAGLWLLFVLINFGILIAGAIIGIPGYFLLRDQLLLLIVLGVVFVTLLVVAMVYVSILQIASFVIIFRDVSEKAGVSASFRKSREFVMPLFITSLLNGLIVFGGFVLLIIPGIVLSIWFAFYQFVVVVEKKRGLLALYQSREYFRGRFFQIIWRAVAWYLPLYALWILFAIFVGEENGGGIDALLQLAMFVLTPFFYAYIFVLYQHVKKTGKSVDTVPATTRRWYFWLPVAGVALLLVLSIMLGSGIAQLMQSSSLPQPADLEAVQESMMEATDSPSY